MNSTYYKSIIENTKVPFWLPMDKKDKMYSEIENLVTMNIPRSLYRFRSCLERNFSAFYNDELWFANGASMNDDFDARLYYNKDEIAESFKATVGDDGVLKIITDLLSQDNIPKEVNELFPNISVICKNLKRLDKENLIYISQELLQFLLSNLDEELYDAVEKIRKCIKFACFSEKIYSDMMWGQYGDNATGFALEYEFGNQKVFKTNYVNGSEYKTWINLFPIVYDNQRLDTTEYATYIFKIRILEELMNRANVNCNTNWINSIVPCPDEFMSTKLALIKSKEWSHEKEWRLFYVTDNNVWAQQEYTCVKYKPSGVCLGRKISPINQKIIMDIALSKNIPVYKMKIDNNSRTYRLKKSKLESI